MRNRHAKILATLGPASRAPDTLRLLHDVGVDAFRLNFSHGSHEDHAASVKNIRDVQKSSGNPICIVADMQGPKLRCGSFEDGKINLTTANSKSQFKAMMASVPQPKSMCRASCPNVKASMSSIRFYLCRR